MALNIFCGAGDRSRSGYPRSRFPPSHAEKSNLPHPPS